MFNLSTHSFFIGAVPPPIRTGLVRPVRSAPFASGAELEIIVLTPILNKGRDTDML